MISKWGVAGLCAGCLAVGYVGGHIDGANPAPAGQAPQSAQQVNSAASAGLNIFHVGAATVQGVTKEVGGLAATAGNAASGIGNGVQQGTGAGSAPATPK